MKRNSHVATRCVVAAVAILLFASARSQAVAQTSFGRMRDAEKNPPAAIEIEDDDASEAKPRAGKTTLRQSKPTPRDAKNGAKEDRNENERVKPEDPKDEELDKKREEKRENDANAENDAESNALDAKPQRRARRNAADKKPDDASGRGPIYGATTTHRYRAGMVFQAQPGGTCVELFGSAPVPMDFPEQKVRTIEEDFPRSARVAYRDLKEGGARQLIFKMRELRGGESVEATASFEVSRRAILPPTEPEIYLIPKQPPTDARRWLKESKYMESNSRTIKALAKETTKDCESAWEKIKAILAFVRDNIQYKETMIEKPMRGALAALKSRDGDCEDMCALFIAMCRAIDAPARLVRVPGHCWAEFYLVDDEKNGFWFPAQVAGTDELGALQDDRVILQKGDSFRLPESPREETMYVKELFTGRVKDGGPDPINQFIQEVDGK